jgi:hypothetical protein
VLDNQVEHNQIFQRCCYLDAVLVADQGLGRVGDDDVLGGQARLLLRKVLLQIGEKIVNRAWEFDI